MFDSPIWTSFKKKNWIINTPQKTSYSHGYVHFGVSFQPHAENTCGFSKNQPTMHSMNDDIAIHQPFTNHSPSILRSPEPSPCRPLPPLQAPGTRALARFARKLAEVVSEVARPPGCCISMYIVFTYAMYIHSVHIIQYYIILYCIVLYYILYCINSNININIIYLCVYDIYIYHVYV